MGFLTQNHAFWTPNHRTCIGDFDNRGVEIGRSFSSNLALFGPQIQNPRNMRARKRVQMGLRQARPDRGGLQLFHFARFHFFQSRRLSQAFLCKSIEILHVLSENQIFEIAKNMDSDLEL